MPESAASHFQEATRFCLGQLPGQSQGQLPGQLHGGQQGTQAERPLKRAYACARAKRGSWGRLFQPRGRSLLSYQVFSAEQKAGIAFMEHQRMKAEISESTGKRVSRACDLQASGYGLLLLSFTFIPATALWASKREAYALSEAQF